MGGPGSMAGGGPGSVVSAPPMYKEKGDLGPEFGIPMPPPPAAAAYPAPPPSYKSKPPGSVYSGADNRSLASGRTAR